jgi:membrane-associated phospholipid phosphatase
MNAMRRWPYTFAVCLSVVVGVTAIVMSHHVGVPLRDPDGFLGPAYIRLPLIGLLFFAAGIVPTALIRGKVRHFPEAFKQILRDEWTWKRVGNITAGLLTFYICYVSYRNIKSDLPLYRHTRFDTQMLNIDYKLFFHHNPAPVLHDLLGTSFSAQILSTVYVAYLPLIPLTLGAFLVWGKDASVSAWYSTALSLNWVLGAVSYYCIPTLGPAFVQQSMFADLPSTSAAELQRSLFHGATKFYDDPGGGSTYGIAGFASLHVSVVVSAVLFLYLTKQKHIVRVISLIYLVLVVFATIYFGWHYLADDIAGAFIGWVAVVVGAMATGNTKRQRAKKQLDAADPGPAPALDVEPAV